MGIIATLLTAVSLAMDAFAVAMCKGLSTRRIQPKQYLIIGAWFGGAQALMPALGYLLGSAFERFITPVDHWIAFALLALIGGNMIKEGLSKEEDKSDDSFSFRTMSVLALATSIDALAVGISLALTPDVNIVLAVVSIGVITFGLSAVGLKMGNVFGLKYKSKAEIAGGVVLVLLGLKILLEDLNILSLPF